MVYPFKTLLQLQAAYLETRSREDLGVLYIECLKGTGYLYRLYLHNKKLTLPEHTIDDDIENATTRLIERYITNPDFRIRHSFRQALNFEVIFVLNNRQRQARDKFMTNVLVLEDVYRMEIDED